jgi:hypothetical protein
MVAVSLRLGLATRCPGRPGTDTATGLALVPGGFASAPGFARVRPRAERAMSSRLLRHPDCHRAVPDGGPTDVRRRAGIIAADAISGAGGAVTLARQRQPSPSPESSWRLQSDRVLVCAHAAYVVRKNVTE